MILGIDVSTYFEELNDGAIYKDKAGNEVSPLDNFIKNGVDYMRIRLWVDPYYENKPYLGGTCDLDNFIKLSKLSLEKGFKIILDFHYSDFWADPGKQFIPKAWQNLTKDELVLKVYEYTKDVLLTLKKNNISLYGIQIGNEITNGMLWPIGKLIDDGKEVRSNYENLIELINSGIKASREIYKDSKIILHLERSTDNKVYREFFFKMKEANVDYDIIGTSYYPFYHGSIEKLMFNLLDIKNTFNKKIMIMELGYAFTTEDYQKDGQDQLVLNSNFENNQDNYIPYPFTEEGQSLFIERLLKECKENKIDGVFYWEPLWIPGKNIHWTSLEGQDYINEKVKSTRNEWANQALYDYNGVELLGLNSFRK